MKLPILLIALGVIACDWAAGNPGFDCFLLGYLLCALVDLRLDRLAKVRA